MHITIEKRSSNRSWYLFPLPACALRRFNETWQGVSRNGVEIALYFLRHYLIISIFKEKAAP